MSEGQVRQAVCLFLMRCIILKATVSKSLTVVGWLVGWLVGLIVLVQLYSVVAFVWLSNNTDLKIPAGRAT